MATIQARKSRGHKYWYIVESRRVNGKPRPVMLAYLGKADDLLCKLQNGLDKFQFKSYSHGAVAALLKTAAELDVCNTINAHINSRRKHVAKKPVRNNITAGLTFLLAAIGRVCMPTSKDAWYDWAKTTSLEYLLRSNFSKLDSQHFWDMMDALPVEAIEKVEETLVKRAFHIHDLDKESLFFDTTNFFTYISSTNEKCTIAKRGKNKQKRGDLRQVGLAMAVTQNDMIPIFHLTYQGNMNDTKVFSSIVEKLKNRLIALNLDIEKHTIVFDRGNNSKQNMELLEQAKLHYVGALTPYHHRDLVIDATKHWELQNINGEELLIYRDKRVIWNRERTVIVFISDKLKSGQIRGIHQSQQKAENLLSKLQKSLQNPKAKKRKKENLEATIKKVVQKQFITNIFDWSLEEIVEGNYRLHYSVDQLKLREIEEQMGFRIIMTDRHKWETADIIKTYYGQAHIEHTFKNLKNPYHLAIKPQFHWTDQKIAVHFFICVMGYLLSAIIWRQVKMDKTFNRSLDTLLDKLNNIRLMCGVETAKTSAKIKVTYKLEEIAEEDKHILEDLKIYDFHSVRPKICGVGVYT